MTPAVAAPTFDADGVQNGVLIRSRNVSIANVFNDLVDSWSDVHVVDRHDDEAGLQAGVEGGALAALEREAGLGEQLAEAALVDPTVRHQGEVLRRGAGREGAAHRGRIEITDEAALHRLGLGIAEEVDHLVHQQLPFPVRVTGIDHAVGLLDEPLDHGKLALGLGLGHQLPLVRHYGELLHSPLFVGGIIGIGLSLLQQVADLVVSGLAFVAVRQVALRDR